MEHVHHIHLFTEDIDRTVAWWCQTLGGVVHFDGEFGGSRNVFMHVGEGRLHFYDQRPRDAGKGAAHHVGIRTDDLRALHARLVALGIPLRSGIREFGAWRYLMCPAPDGVLLELFEVEGDQLDPALADYFLGVGWRERRDGA
jgi:catechol 2,3-dioxygenase-like lactoylglutathione lyase family enzyme